MVRRVQIVVLLGIHGAGKSTFGAALPRQRYAFFPEIGTSLRDRAPAAVSESQAAFDEEVMHRELARDVELLREPRLPVVETWHLGNLAFAMARGSSGVVNRYRSALRGQMSRFDISIVRLVISDDQFLSRVTEKLVSPADALRFYRSVESHQKAIVDEFVGASGRPPLTVRSPWRPRESDRLLRSVLGPRERMR